MSGEPANSSEPEVEELRSSLLVDELFRRSRLSPLVTISLVTALLVLLLVLAIHLEGGLTGPDAADFWRIGLEAPVIIAYILVAYLLYRRLDYRALDTFRPLLSATDREFHRLARGVLTLDRRWEWGALFIGAAFWVGTGQPWNMDTDYLGFRAYAYSTHILEFSLLGWLVYVIVATTQRLARLSQQPLNLDIFQPGQLTPVALRSLGISLFIIGGMSLSLVFQTRDGLTERDNLVIYGILVLITMLVFFRSMWSAHKTMAEAKKRELDLARKHLAETSRELKEKGMEGRATEVNRLHSALATWITYEGRVKEAREWPYDGAVIRRLVAAIPIPGIIYAVKIFLFGT